MGRLTRDFESRPAGADHNVYTSSIAIDGGKDKPGMFFDIEAWDKIGETLTKYFVKGNLLPITYKLKQDSWEDAETKQKRNKVTLVITDFGFAGEKREDGGTAPSATPAAPKTASKSKDKIPDPFEDE